MNMLDAKSMRSVLKIKDQNRGLIFRHSCFYSMKNISHRHS
uniref:Uncharacterized protein n=1 Tax=Arundo donax TaxID=35708 RepID=A0A0A9BRG0_ARUDO